MSVIKERYRDLAPIGVNLSDTVVLAQAWKKAHKFIRQHNWYADGLELDCSVVDLERALAQWSIELASPTYVPDKLRLVPAPKNAKWIFVQHVIPNTVSAFLDSTLEALSSEPSFSDWSAKRESKTVEDSSTEVSTQKLRPLAHISIRDQTFATSVMMCLAEAVETAQGDSSEPDVMKSRAARVASYGNRLHCHWDGQETDSPRARFPWGNGRSYRQFFQDYRTFLARPRLICAEYSGQVQSNRELYVVTLDIKSFYDQVDCAALIKILRNVQAQFEKQVGVPPELAADELFWARTTSIFNWAWRDGEHLHAPVVNGEFKLALGLPQGLVASGFFANAYLLGLDKKMGDLVEQQHSLGAMKLIDYCRYVDDVRIVVESTSRLDGVQLVALLDSAKLLLTEQLALHCAEIGARQLLELSPSKCSVVPYRSISAQSNISALMEVLQSELSGPFDMDSLVQAAGGLEGLLLISDQVDEAPAPVRSRLNLANIAMPNTDVRDDTVKRFVATRIAQLLRHRLAMTDRSAPAGISNRDSERVTQGSALTHEFETTARKLIKCWAENPSLVLLLRCGLDLFPHPRLLAPVIEALVTKVFHQRHGPFSADDEREVRVAQYVVADLFRAGTVETGFRAIDEYPDRVDIIGYREHLAVLARRFLAPTANSPWYLQQQALLFLASVGDHSVVVSNQEDLKAHSDLHCAMSYAPTSSEPLLSILPLALVGQQLNSQPERFGMWFCEALRETKESDIQNRAIATVSLNRPDLMMATLNSRMSRTREWRKFVPNSIISLHRNSSSKATPLKNGGEVTLLRLMAFVTNEFSQENALLLLTQALLRFPSIIDDLNSGVDASEITLTCEDWDEIQALPEDEGFFKVVRIQRASTVHPLYSTPIWIDVDKAWLYGLGRILRAALTGELDYTTRRYLVTEELGGYRGLRGTWFSRQFGLLNSNKGLLDEPAPVSPWLSDFLSNLLQWPGIVQRSDESKPSSLPRTPEELLRFVNLRVADQRALYGHRSRMPIYVIPTAEGAPLENRPLRVAIVQPLLPRRDDFDVKDPTHWTPKMMAKHKRHLAEVCKLTYQKLRTWESARGSATSDRDGNTPAIDIVLFPELAVHPEHMRHLRILSDMVGASIFTGLTFLKSPRTGAVINQGMWLIRTKIPGGGRDIQYVWQGKKHPMKLERDLGIVGYRPHTTLIEFPIGVTHPTRVAATICYDATDLDLLADLRERSDMFLVSALNQDVQTFDNMVAALHFHMYQPVVLANSGEFGGSTAQAPLPKHERLISHVHGNDQIAVSIFEIDPSPFKSTKLGKAPVELKAAPAGYMGRPGKR